MARQTPEAQPGLHVYQFDVDGMTCAACVANVEGALKELAGVETVTVNLAMESATITSTTAIPIKNFSRAVSRMGYSLEAQGSSSLVERQERTIATWKRLLVIQAIFGIPLLVYAMAEMFLHLHILSSGLNMLVQSILATILVVSGTGYYRRGFKHLLQRVPNMDSLVALGTGSAFVYSIISSLNLTLAWGLESFQTLYYEAAGTILLFITFGKWLEAVARGKTTEALTGLMDQMPSSAEVRRDGEWQTLPLDQLHIGDEVRVQPHTKIPVDGKVLEGISSVDESSISGEPMPVSKQTGSQVIGASMNLENQLIIQAEKIGRESVFGQIISLVEKAQGQKPEIQKLVDRIAAVFVPVVLTLAVLSGLTWFLLGYGLTFAVNVMISVLIIACPCALGLATPTALVVSSGIAARGGILIKSPDAFQLLSGIDTLVLDKTGTLTEAKPVVVEHYPSEPERFMGIALGLESHSQHPLAKAILEYGRKLGISSMTFSHIQETAGQGVQGSHGGSLYSIGQVDLTASLDQEMKSQAEAMLEKGQTLSGVYRDGELLAVMALSDTLKPEAERVIAGLNTRGIQCMLLTGDKQRAARHAAEQVGIETFRAEVLPQDKHDVIKDLKRSGKTVGMIGDGINDAPALVAADIGLSFSGGTDIAVNAADIIFLNASLENLVYAHRIAKATLSKIKQNLFWAFVYNLAGIPIAMGVLYPLTGTLLNPMFAGMAMAFSSVSVVSNTLLLRSRNFFKAV